MLLLYYIILLYDNEINLAKILSILYFTYFIRKNRGNSDVI